jgi:hypothetical protein
MTLACGLVGVLTPVVRAQAGLEYAAKSARNALSNTRAGMHLGVCPLDNAVVSCVHHYYPMPLYVGIVAICFLLYLLFFPKRRA